MSTQRAFMEFFSYVHGVFAAVAAIVVAVPLKRAKFEIQTTCGDLVKVRKSVQ